MQINQREDRGRHQRGLIRNIVDYCRARFIFAQRPNYLTAWHILALTINQKRSFLIKGAVSRQSSSFCLILPITRPQSLWNLK